MDNQTIIRWTETRWDPLVGCTRKSAACKNCYAEAWTAKNSEPGNWGHGYVEGNGAGATWSGKIGLLEDRLQLPISLEEPSLIFVNSLSDLFHEALDDGTIDRIFAVMALEPRHYFQILTKRPKVMQRYLTEPTTRTRINSAMQALSAGSNSIAGSEITTWPLPNVWLGVTAENQKEADRRIPLLLETPSAIRFIAAEPLLEPIDLKVGTWLKGAAPESVTSAAKIDWVVAGGEISHKATLCQPEWARSLRDQCARSGTAFFWNQWGEHGSSGSETSAGTHLLDGALYENYPLPHPKQPSA
jgi:protein gp37